MSTTRTILALALAAGALVGAGLGARGAGSAAPAWAEVTSNDGTYVVRYRVAPEDFEVGDLFGLTVDVRRADGAPLAASLAVDARMPEHGHGMNREPIVGGRADGEAGGGRFEAENLLFHMPGYWEVYLDLTRGAVTERAQFSIDLE